MDRVITWLRGHPLLLFFALSYALTWPGWWLEVRGSQAGAILGYFGPALAAILVAAAAGGGEELARLLGRLFRWRVPLRWYLVAILLPLGSVLVVVAILALARGPSPAFDPAPLKPILPQLGMALIFGSLYGVIVAAGEELGWRGYALPHLLARHHPLVASLVVGIFWGLWHLPVSFLFEGQTPSLVDALLYGLGIDFAAVIYTWLFLHTGGSVLIASLFHAVYDVALLVVGQAAQIAGLGFSFPLHVLVLAIVAAPLVVVAGPQLAKSTRPTWQGTSPALDLDVE